jgi:hypothetical protein
VTNDIPDFRRLRWMVACKACREVDRPYPPMDATWHDCGYAMDDLWDWKEGTDGWIRWRVSHDGTLKALVVYGMVTRKVGRKTETFRAPVGGQRRDEAIWNLHQQQKEAGQSGDI